MSNWLLSSLVSYITSLLGFASWRGVDSPFGFLDKRPGEPPKLYQYCSEEDVGAVVQRQIKVCVSTLLLLFG